MQAKMRDLNERERAALEDLKKTIVVILEEIRQLVILLLPLAVRGVCVLVGVAGTAQFFWRAWAAYGGDALATIPAAMMAIAPVGFGMLAGLSWGGLCLGGALALAGAEALSHLDLYGRILLVVSVMGWAVYSVARPREGKEETYEAVE